MKEKDILAMKPGAKLNAYVAKHVLKHDIIDDEFVGQTERLTDEDGNSVWSEVMPYSEDLSAAQTVVEEMIKRGYSEAPSWEDYGNGIYAPAEAICKRALLAVLEADR